jgi:hypothetical protein
VVFVLLKVVQYFLALAMAMFEFTTLADDVQERRESKQHGRGFNEKDTVIPNPCPRFTGCGGAFLGGVALGETKHVKENGGSGRRQEQGNVSNALMSNPTAFGIVVVVRCAAWHWHSTAQHRQKGKFWLILF